MERETGHRLHGRGGHARLPRETTNAQISGGQNGVGDGGSEVLQSGRAVALHTGHPGHDHTLSECCFFGLFLLFCF